MNNGKGDAPRRVNLKVYRENYAAINWRKHRTLNTEHRTPNADGEQHLIFMRSMGFDCKDEQDAYELRGLLDL